MLGCATLRILADSLAALPFGGILSCTSLRLLVAGVLIAAFGKELLLGGVPSNLLEEESEEDWVLDAKALGLSTFSGVQGITPLQ